MELPEGIEFNSLRDERSETLLPYSIEEIWKCFDCNLTLQTIIIGENNRLEGVVHNVLSDQPLWRSKLPKDIIKAKKYLKENLNLRIEKHKAGHR